MISITDMKGETERDDDDEEERERERDDDDEGERVIFGRKSEKSES